MDNQANKLLLPGEENYHAGNTKKTCGVYWPPTPRGSFLCEFKKVTGSTALWRDLMAAFVSESRSSE